MTKRYRMVFALFLLAMLVDLWLGFFFAGRQASFPATLCAAVYGMLLIAAVVYSSGWFEKNRNKGDM